MAIVLVANAAAGSADGNSVTTGAIDTTGADLIVAYVSSYTAVAIPPVTDSKSNTWTPLTLGAVTVHHAKLHYCVPTSVGSGHTFTASTTTSLAAICVAAFSGGHATPLDQQSGAVAFGVTSIQPGSLTPPANDHLFVTGVSFEATPGAPTINAGFTITDFVAGSGSHFETSMAYLIQTTAAAINPTWSFASATAVTRMATFAPAAGGGGGGGIVRQMMQHHYRKPAKRTAGGLAMPSHAEFLRYGKVA